MTYWRLKNKWCANCPNNQEAVDNVHRELINQIRQNSELRTRLRLALEKIDELAEQLRVTEALVDDVDS